MPGAAPPADFVEGASATQSIDGFGSYVFSSSAELVADVQNWLSNPSGNFGWILICDDEAIAGSAHRFGSREDPANAPSLAVEYGPALRMEQAAVVGNTFKFSFTAQVGQAYLGQSADSLPTQNWVTFTNIPAPAATQTISVTTPVNGPQRFYRLALP